MAVYDLEEQEQLDALKAWWSSNGNYLTWAVLVIVLGFAGFQGYRYWQHSQSQKASDAYAQLDQAVRANDSKKVREIGTHIAEKFSSTGFGPMAALTAAKASFDAGDLKSAGAQLKWVADNAKDEDLRATARLRLAGVRLDEKNFDGALALLDEKHPESFAALYADARGDVLVAQGKRAQARTAYKLALEKFPADNPYRPVVQVKMDDLGAAP